MIETTMGQVEITVYDNLNYTITNSFNNTIEELVFLLFMIDKVLVDIEDPKYVPNIASLVGRYIIDLDEGREKLAKFYEIYNLVTYDNSEVIFKVNQKLISKEMNQGEHLYVWTDYNSKNPHNYDVNLGINALLYTKSFMDRLDYDEQNVCADAYRSLLQIYLDTKYPDTTNITKAPSSVVNRLIESNNGMNYDY